MLVILLLTIEMVLKKTNYNSDLVTTPDHGPFIFSNQQGLGSDFVHLTKIRLLLFIFYFYNIFKGS